MGYYHRKDRLLSYPIHNKLKHTIPIQMMF